MRRPAVAWRNEEGKNRVSDLLLSGRSTIELRVARLASMPPDPQAALQRFKAQVRDAWTSLGAVRGAELMHAALHTSRPVLPPLRHARPESLDELLGDLDLALCNHHAEEICVVCYTLLSVLLESVHRELGEARVQAVLGTLEYSAS